tara:strand:- start:259 stop:1044 length:786 start_codon:yes stop_codon:yes gene_type:complete
VEIYIKERKNNMAYAQHFGLSRNSPLNMGGENTSKEIEPKVNTNPGEASSIIEENNKKVKLREFSYEDFKENLQKKADVSTKKEQDYQDNKSSWTKNLDGLQDVASVGGLVPAVGAFADIPNALLSGARTVTNAIGDTVKGITSGGNFDYRRTKEHAANFLLNSTAAIPVAGQAAGVTRLGMKAPGYLNKIKKAGKGAKVLKYIDKGQDILTASSGLSGAKNLVANTSNNKKQKGIPNVSKTVGLIGLTGKINAKMASFFN